ncbi:hypothetical protein [Profundibacterium mesophilum]|uniref:Envelope glycoprotein C n=1 Tax=Profundibacterium mesophilum KAUST100406-0324 TaxID=1037889 RepID=A0A921TBX0_9RHOB|nr:hypothetical protein [Profundibacterium mesophilum]KAF0674968.1 envelope glycoprotein C [Profundibacterium mesophilum KAUST100406-0324]
MKKTLALDLSHTGIRVTVTAGSETRTLGEVALDDPALDAALRDLRAMAQAQSDGPLETLLVIPASEILYLSVDAAGDTAAARETSLRAQLEGRTPYDLSELVYDWRALDETRVALAAVAIETLSEAETFAVNHGFNPRRFTALPRDGAFPGRADFGPTAHASGAPITATPPPPDNASPHHAEAAPAIHRAAGAEALAPAREDETPAQAEAPQDETSTDGLASDAVAHEDVPASPELPGEAAPIVDDAAMQPGAGADLPDPQAESAEPEGPAENGGDDATGPSDTREAEAGETGEDMHDRRDAAPEGRAEADAVAPEEVAAHPANPESQAPKSDAAPSADAPVPVPVIEGVPESLVPAQEAEEAAELPSASSTSDAKTSSAEMGQDKDSAAEDMPNTPQETGAQDEDPRPAKCSGVPLSTLRPDEAAADAPATVAPSGPRQPVEEPARFGPKGPKLPPRVPAGPAAPARPAMGPVAGTGAAAAAADARDAAVGGDAKGARAARPHRSAPNGAGIAKGTGARDMHPRSANVTPGPATAGPAAILAARAGMTGETNGLAPLAPLSTSPLDIMSFERGTAAARRAPATTAKPAAPQDEAEALTIFGARGRAAPGGGLPSGLVAGGLAAALVGAFVLVGAAWWMGDEAEQTGSPREMAEAPVVEPEAPQAAPAPDTPQTARRGAADAAGVPTGTILSPGGLRESALFDDAPGDDSGDTALLAPPDDAAPATGTDTEREQGLELAARPDDDTALFAEPEGTAASADPDDARAAPPPSDGESDPAGPDAADPLARQAVAADTAIRYAMTGVWDDAPSMTAAPGGERLDDLNPAPLDPAIEGLALPVRPSDTGPGFVPTRLVTLPPPPSGRRFDFGADGMIVATAEGALNPDGIIVTKGTPPATPPARPDRPAGDAPQESGETPATADAAPDAEEAVPPPAAASEVTAAEAAQDPLAGDVAAGVARLEPRPRPEPAGNTTDADGTPDAAGAGETAQTTSSDSAAAGIAARVLTPEAAPGESVEPAEEAPAAAPVSPYAVERSRSPARRPADLAVRAAAAAAARSIAGTGGSQAGQALRQPGTPELGLAKVNLVGVYGSASNRRALVRLPTGRFVKLKVGDTLDGGRVAQIDAAQLSYVRDGRTIVLDMPNS